LQHHIGCSGWSYTAWEGHFYPKGLESKDYLKYYSSVFDYVEIDSSFYRTPNTFMTTRWLKNTPDNFRFTAKFPKSITHDKRLGIGVEADCEYFFKSMSPLANKILCLILQLPPSMTMKEGLKKLESLPFDNRFRYAIEARHKSWFTDEVYLFLKKNDICLAWSQLADIQTPSIVTTDFIYLRLIGDRSIPEEQFGKIQKDRDKEMRYWAGEINKLSKKEDKKLKVGIVAANNHYAGFGPASADMFRRLVGLPEAKWEEKRQSTLSDFG
jgi:uncharacterized protein YecE (DUF72 family)